MATVRSVAKKLRDAMSHEAGKAAAPLVTTTMPGTIVAVDGKGNATVDMGNGQQATVMLGIGAHAGDHVDVEFGGMSAVATRNRTDPPDNAIARDAEKVADEAAAVANATGQHFWDDGNGVHVADESRDDWDEEWAKSGHGSIGSPTSQRPWHNILINSLGLLLRMGINNLVGITRSAIAFYDGLGNADTNITARFGADGEQIGKTDESHMELDYHSMRLVDMFGTKYFEVIDLRNENNVATLVETFAGDGTTTEFTVGVTVHGEVSAVDSGDATNAATRSGKKYTFAHAPSASSTVTITYQTRSDFAKAYTLGVRGDGNEGPMSVAEGNGTVASGFLSHAEGSGSKATAAYSHAEGWATEAHGKASHAEGFGAETYGEYSHAEGWNTEARGKASHAQNRGTVAGYDYQTAIGKYNDNQSGNALEIGNGVDGHPANILAVDWFGDVECGDVNGVDVSDSGWLTLPLASGWEAYDAAQTPRYRRVCGVVQIVGAVKPTADTTVGASFVTIGNIPPTPSGFRPPQRMLSLNPASSANRVMVSAEVDGGVRIGRYGTGSGYVTVTPSHWVPIGIMYLA